MSYSLLLTQQGHKPNSLLSIDGKTWPNWGFNDNGTLTLLKTLTSNTTFTYSSINTIVPSAVFGTRYSLCIQTQSSTISNIYFVISTTQPLSTASSITGLLGSSYIYYSSNDNMYYMSGNQLGFPTLFPYTDIGVDAGQIYVRIEEDGKVFSGKGKATSAFIGKLTANAGDVLYIGLVVQNTTGTGTGDYLMTPLNFLNPAPTTIPLNPLFNQTPLTGYNPSSLVLQNGSLNQSITGLNANTFYTYIAAETQSYNTDVYYLLNLSPNGNSIRIGFYTNGAIASGVSNSLTSVTKPDFYYDSITGGCFAGTTRLVTIPNNLTVLFIRLDENLNFYVGRTDTNYQLVCNLATYYTLLNNNTRSFRLGYEIKTL